MGLLYDCNLKRRESSFPDPVPGEVPQSHERLAPEPGPGRRLARARLQLRLLGRHGAAHRARVLQPERWPGQRLEL